MTTHSFIDAIELTGSLSSSSSPSFLIIIGLVLILAALPLLPRIFSYIRIYRKAKRDYAKARGTQHKRFLTHGLTQLDTMIKVQEQRKQEMTIERKQAEQEKERQLDHALYSNIIETYLPGAEGVGEKLTRKILDQCFDGTLTSLNRAHVVNGVGKAKQESIDQWLKDIEKIIPEYQHRDFPHRNDITKEFSMKMWDLEVQIASLERDLKKNKNLRSQVRFALTPLEKVDFSVFLGSYFDRPGERDSGMVDGYLLGSYPEWEPKPKWFEDLENSLGGKDSGMVSG